MALAAERREDRRGVSSEDVVVEHVNEREVCWWLER